MTCITFNRVLQRGVVHILVRLQTNTKFHLHKVHDIFSILKHFWGKSFTTCYKWWDPRYRYIWLWRQKYVKFMSNISRTHKKISIFCQVLSIYSMKLVVICFLFTSTSMCLCLSGASACISWDAQKEVQSKVQIVASNLQIIGHDLSAC